jgi:alcohol dehydrogenase class IV
MRFSMNNAKSRFAAIGAFLRDETVGHQGYGANPEDSIREVVAFIKDIGAPSTLREQGVQEKDFGRIAEDTLRVTAGSVGLDVRKASREDIINILRDAF